MSRLDYTTFLKHENKLSHHVYWTSFKSKQSAGLSFGSKVMTFAKCFDMAFSFEHDMKCTLRKHILFSMVFYPQYLLDVVTEATRTTGKRLTIDLQSLKDVYKSFELSKVALVQSVFDIADVHTKPEIIQLWWIWFQTENSSTLLNNEYLELKRKIKSWLKKLGIVSLSEVFSLSASVKLIAG